MGESTASRVTICIASMNACPRARACMAPAAHLVAGCVKGGVAPPVEDRRVDELHQARAQAVDVRDIRTVLAA